MPTNQIPNPLPAIESQPKQIKKAYTEADIQLYIDQLAEKLNQDYAQQEVILVGILKGCLPFLSDLAKKLTFDTRIEFVRLSSYGNSMESKGTITVLKDISIDIKDKHVLIIEEIIDSGRTLGFYLNRLKASEPKSLKIVALFDKKMKRTVPIEADYVGKECEDYFLIGYGLDLAETCRNTKDVYYLEF
jgi:hypoxanthine phosphoribosyltransferase